MPEIICAMEAKIEFVKMTNPFGGAKEEKPLTASDLFKDIQTDPRTKVYGK